MAACVNRGARFRVRTPAFTAKQVFLPLGSRRTWFSNPGWAVGHHSPIWVLGKPLVPSNQDESQVLKEQFGKHPGFCSTCQGQPLRADVTKTAWHTALKRAGIGITDFRLLDLRHTWASCLWQVGTSCDELKGLVAGSLGRWWASVPSLQLRTCWPQHPDSSRGRGRASLSSHVFITPGKQKAPHFRARPCNSWLLDLGSNQGPNAVRRPNC